MDWSVFRNKRVLITGDTGFKGAWLCTWLHTLGAEVFGFALPPKIDAPLFGQMGLNNKIRHTDGDIRDPAAAVNAIAEARPEIIFHLAAQSLVIDGYDSPRETFDTNVMGGVNVLDAVRNAEGVRAFIYVTTDKVYRNHELGRNFCEDDELGGVDPYGASKAAAEMAFSAYQESFYRDKIAFGAASVRAGNVIGGGDWAANRIMPDCIRAFRAGLPVTLRNPVAVRPWQHVLEPLSGYLQLAAALIEAPSQYRGVWNFGPDEDGMRSVRDLAAYAARCWNGAVVSENPPANAPHEATLLYLDSSKARRDLSWLPVWQFESAVAETVGWYKAVTGGADAFTESQRQIETYMGAMA